MQLSSKHTEWSQKTAFDKEERDFKTNNPLSLTCIQIQTRGTVVGKNPKPLTFLLQAAFITECVGFILAVTFTFDGLLWITSQTDISSLPHMWFSGILFLAAVFCMGLPQAMTSHRGVKGFSAPGRHAVSTPELWQEVSIFPLIRRTGLRCLSCCCIYGSMTTYKFLEQNKTKQQKGKFVKGMASAFQLIQYIGDSDNHI